MSWRRKFQIIGEYRVCREYRFFRQLRIVRLFHKLRKFWIIRVIDELRKFWVFSFLYIFIRKLLIRMHYYLTIAQLHR